MALKNKNVIMVYYHRLCSDTDIDLLAMHHSCLADIFKTRKNTVHIFAFTQHLVPDKQYRGIGKMLVNGINLYVFNILSEWQGDNQEIFWARCDDDLLKQMI